MHIHEMADCGLKSQSHRSLGEAERKRVAREVGAPRVIQFSDLAPLVGRAQNVPV